MSVPDYSPPCYKIVHYTYADFVSRQIGRPVHIVQCDDNLPILAVKLYSDGQPYTIPSNSDANIRMVKPDGKHVYNPALGCDSTRHTVYFAVTQQMAVFAGESSPVVEIYTNGSIASTSSIGIVIDRNPVSNDTLVSSDEYKTVMQYAKEATEAAASASASRSASKISETNAKTSETNAKATETNVKASETNAKTSETNAKASETNATTYALRAKTSAEEAASRASIAGAAAWKAESYAKGDTGTRTGENTDNAKYYSEKSREYSDSWKGSLLPKGEVTFAHLPVVGNTAGHMYTITESFVTDTKFRSGAGFSYPPRTRVYWTDANKWEVLTGTWRKELSKSEYDELSDAEKMNGTYYHITDDNDEIPDATDTTKGLVKVDRTLSNSSVNPVQNKVVTVAIGNKVDKVSGKDLSTNDYTTTEKNKLSGIAANANNYSLPLASSIVRGGVKTGYSKNGKNYPVQLSSEKMYVNVPWDGVWFGVCGSKKADVAKVVDASGFQLNEGTRITVYFTWGNTAENITLNVGGTGAKAVLYKNSPVPANFIQIDCGIDMVHYAGAWRIIGEFTGALPSKELTQAQYNALSSSEKMNGTIYFITDGN